MDACSSTPVRPNPQGIPVVLADDHLVVRAGMRLLLAQDPAFRIVAESEGALVAKAYLLAHPGAPVDTLVLLRTLDEPGSAYYPPSGDDGGGAAAGFSLHWSSAAARTLSPLDGVGPDDLTIDALVTRAHDKQVTEVILALNATVDGQTTAHYITDLLHNAEVKVTRLAHGVPVGGELDYLDEGTLSAAIRQRTLF